MSDRLRASFDLIAEPYAVDFADELNRKPWDVERLRRFAACCRAGPVLDVGCGPAAHVGRLVAELGPRVLGVDLAPRALAVARRRVPALPLIAADMRALPFADGVCTGIVAFYSLIYEADPAPALMELRRVLRGAGTLLVAMHAGEGWRHFGDYKGVPVDVELHLREPGRFADQVRRAGFALDAVEVRPPYPFEHATERLYVAATAV